MRRRPADRRGAHARSARRRRRLISARTTDLIVIPARHASTRLPGKPLRMIAGHTLLARTVALARRASEGLAGVSILVATDHPAIAAHAESLGVAAVLTDAALSSGSARTLAAADATGFDGEVLINLQGDSPFVAPAAVRLVLEAARAGGADVTTAVARLSWTALDALREHKLRSPFSGTTCVRAVDGGALWFSKAIVPAIRDEATLRGTSPESPVWRHVGLYAYTLPALRRFHALPPSPYERLEGLEQLRFLENGMSIATVEVAPSAFDMSGIDTEADVARAEVLIAAHGDPLAAP